MPENANRSALIDLSDRTAPALDITSGTSSSHVRRAQILADGSGNWPQTSIKSDSIRRQHFARWTAIAFVLPQLSLLEGILMLGTAQTRSAKAHHYKSSGAQCSQNEVMPR